jgi:hypothetical protein
LRCSFAGPLIAKPELQYPESTALKSTRPTGSGDPAQYQQATPTLGFAIGLFTVPGRWRRGSVNRP